MYTYMYMHIARSAQEPRIIGFVLIFPTWADKLEYCDRHRLLSILSKKALTTKD